MCRRPTNPLLSDATLVAMAKVGRFEAFDELIERYRGPISTVLRSHGLGDGAEDAAQEVWLTAYRHLANLRDGNRFGSWIYAIARRQAVRFARREKTERTALQESIDQAVRDRSLALRQRPDWQATVRQESLEMREAICALPKEFREALLLRTERDWTVAQTAAFLGVPESTVKWRLHEAKRLLRQRLASIKET